MSLGVTDTFVLERTASPKDKPNGDMCMSWVGQFILL